MHIDAVFHFVERYAFPVFAALVVAGGLAANGSQAVRNHLGPWWHEQRVQSAVADLAARAEGLDDRRLRALAEKQAAEYEPLFLRELYYQLLDRKHGRAATFVAEAGAEKYGDPTLLFLAGREYARGRYVERDWEKAARFLSDDEVQKTSAGQYWYGWLLVAKANPNGDIVRGAAVLREAASSYEKAQALLESIKPRLQKEEAKRIAADLAARAEGLIDRRLLALAEEQAARHDPPFLRDLFYRLLDANRGRAATFVAEAGAEKYGDPTLLLLAGREYARGRFVERDWGKAARFLSDDEVQKTSAGQYWYGWLLVAKANPNGDIVRGAAVLREAASSYEKAQALLESIKPRLQKEEAKRIAADLAARAEGLDDRRLRALAEEQAARHDPPVLVALFRDLLRAKNGRLATLVAAAGAEKYGDPTLLFYAGREYALGRFVERNWEKAARFLSDDQVQKTASGKYWYGWLLVAKANPNRDTEWGMALIRQAAAENSPAAKAFLDRYDVRPAR